MQRPNFPLLIKPISDICNLDCAYCFYKERPTIPNISKKRMSLATYKRLVEVYEPFVKIPSYIWQGGEPTILGLDYFKSVSEIQSDKSENCIQTNGYYINQEWADFFKENGWLVGISLDCEKNNLRDMNTEIVEQTIQTLRTTEVLYNILCVVSKENVNNPEETITYLSRHGTYIQFIPAQPVTPGDFTYAPSGEEYKEFMRRAIDCVRTNNLNVVIENFEQAVNAWYNIHYSCESTKRCGTYLTIESNGNIYPCDFFVEDRWEVGNIFKVDNLAELMPGSKMTEFRDLKTIEHEDCAICPVKAACNMGCPRHRYLLDGNFSDKTIFCEEHKLRFSAAYNLLKTL